MLSPRLFNSFNIEVSGEISFKYRTDSSRQLWWPIIQTNSSEQELVGSKALCNLLDMSQNLCNKQVKNLISINFCLLGRFYLYAKHISAIIWLNSGCSFENCHHGRTNLAQAYQYTTANQGHFQYVIETNHLWPSPPYQIGIHICDSLWHHANPY